MVVDTYACGSFPVVEYFHAVSHVLIFVGTYPVSRIILSRLNFGNLNNFIRKDFHVEKKILKNRFFHQSVKKFNKSVVI